MYLEIAAATYLIGQFVYHRWFEDKPKPKPARTLSLPRTDDGAHVPMIFGKCRVRAPLLAHASHLTALEVDGSGLEAFSGGQPFVYGFEALYILGIPFTNSTNRIHKMYVGEIALPNPFPSGDDLDDLTGDGSNEYLTTNPALSSIPIVDSVGIVGGRVEFLNGKPTQQLVDPTTPYAATTKAGERISEVTDPAQIPGYRGYMSAFLWNTRSDIGWIVGTSPQVQNYSFEVSSFPNWSAYPIASDANPVDVIYDLITGVFGKLNAGAVVSFPSFAAAALQLQTEAHGYSRALEDGQTALEIITDILIQIDATLYEDPADGLIKIKLIRPDYTPSALRIIDPSNCVSLESFSASGWSNLPNKIRVVFTDRDHGYQDGSGAAQNQANAVGQDGTVTEITLQMPGICTQALADKVAGRELSARSRPMIKCRAVVDRSFYRNVEGDVLKVTWPEYGIHEMIFRVASVNRGAPGNSHIALDLIQDFFTWDGDTLVGGIDGF